MTEKEKPVRTDQAYGHPEGDERETPGRQGDAQSGSGAGGHRWPEDQRRGTHEPRERTVSESDENSRR